MIKHTLLSALILLAAPVFAQDSAPLPDAGLLNQNPSTLEAKQGLKKPASKIASPAASASSPASEAPASEAVKKIREALGLA